MAVGEREKRQHLFALEKFLEHEPCSRASQLTVIDELGGFGERLFTIGDDGNALSTGESVGLDHERHADFLALDHRGRFLHGAHHVIAGGGNGVALEEILRERFAAFELRGRSVGTEYAESATLELVREAENQRELGTDHGETDGEILGKISELDDVGRVDVDAIRDARDAGVSRSAVELGHLRALLELPREDVLTPASTYDEHPHEIAVKFNIISNLRYSLNPVIITRRLWRCQQFGSCVIRKLEPVDNL